MQFTIKSGMGNQRRVSAGKYLTAQGLISDARRYFSENRDIGNLAVRHTCGLMRMQSLTVPLILCLCCPDLAECTLKVPAQDEFDVSVGILAPDQTLS